MAKSSTIISLPQMIDLALNSPEMGVINFTLLHSALQVIVKKLQVADTSVEFRGQESERVQNFITTAKPGPQLALSEYTVSEDPKDKKKGKKKKTVSGKEKGKADEEQTEKGSSSESSLPTVVVIESSIPLKDDPPKFTVAMTKDYVEQLQKDMEKLKEQMTELKDLPANIGLIEAIKSSGSSEKITPVLDMFQILNLVKRVDAAEAQMTKLGSMMEDLLKKKLDLMPHTGESVKTENSPKQKLDLMPQEGEIETSPSPEKNKENKELEERVEELEKKINELSKEGSRRVSLKSTAKGSEGTGGHSPVSAGSIPSIEKEIIQSEAEGTDLTQVPVGEAIGIIQNDMEVLRNMCNNDFIQAVKDIQMIKEKLQKSDDLPSDVRLGQVEIKFNECLEQLNSLDTMYNNQIQLLQQKIADLEKEIGGLVEQVNLGMPGGDAPIVGEHGVMELHHKLQGMQDEFTNISETANTLMEEQNARRRELDILTEQIELLKTVKADREDLEDALADKADTCTINRKVSHSQFESACDCLSKGIEEALSKLEEQQNMWLQALDEIQKEVGNKLDRVEMGPLRDFINSKLKHLQQNVKSLAAMKKEQEAAGTKSKYLRDVNCISCDKDVVMRKEVSASMYPTAYALPPTRNMGPYLAYELDQLRKQQKCVPNSKNLNMLENALITGKSGADKDHICNRYCGGSHTVTTPQQRVTRIGHFLEQWGPEISPVLESGVRGTDGQIYKGHEDIQKKTMTENQVRRSDEIQIDIVKMDDNQNKLSMTPQPTRGSAEGKPETERKLSGIAPVRSPSAIKTVSGSSVTGQAPTKVASDNAGVRASQSKLTQVSRNNSKTSRSSRTSQVKITTEPIPEDSETEATPPKPKGKTATITEEPPEVLTQADEPGSGEVEPEQIPPSE